MPDGSYTNFPNGLTSFGIPVIPGLPLTTGNIFFVDPVTGSDANPGSASQPLASVYKGHALATAGNNDVIVLVGDGGTTATQRLSLANAQAVSPAVTAGTLVWSKNATHLVGMTAPARNSPRARFAPPTGVYTVTTFGSGNFVTVSATGCIFSNFSLFHGFSTGGNNQICWTDSGARNYYNNVHFGGAADAGSAQSTSSRSFLSTGTGGEHTFVDCSFGVDTVVRTVANATLAFAGGNTRCTFQRCTFQMDASANTPMHVSVPTDGIDRWVYFDDCAFFNAVESAGTAIAAGIIAAADAGGAVVLRNPVFLGATAVATTGPVYAVGNVPVATTSGIAIKMT